MPSALPTPCSHGRCPEVTTERYCEEHKSEKWSDDDRPSASERGYDRAWQKARNSYWRRVGGLCERCRSEGVTREGEVVHHMTPIKQGGARLDPGNLELLCRRHHRQEHS